jgi:hypothetical protein
MEEKYLGPSAMDSNLAPYLYECDNASNLITALDTTLWKTTLEPLKNKN